jgi:hypothetical protein
MPDGLLRVLEAAAGGLVGGLVLMLLAGAIFGLRWAINHGVDSIAALFGRGQEARRLTTGIEVTNMDPIDRRFVLSGLATATVLGKSAAPAAAQGGTLPGPIVQPAEKTKAGFLARARALRDQAVREGDQAYGAVVVRNGLIVGEGRNYVVLHSDPTAHAELLAVRDAARRLGTRDLSDCDVYSTATPCPMCQGALFWARIRRYHNEGTPAEGVPPRLAC